MSGHDVMWQAIRGSPFFGIYLSELYWLSKQVEVNTTRIFDDTPPPPQPGNGYIRVDHELHERILSVLLGAARLRSLVRSRTTNGSRAQREVLQRRTSELQKLLNGIDLNPVLDSAARNSVEHFDEYLDKTAIESYRGDILKPTLFAFDLVLSSRSLLAQFHVGGSTPAVRFFRAYIADERVFSSFERELQLEPLRDCCSSMRNRIEPLLPDLASDERNGGMLVITEKSFGNASPSV